MDTRYFEELAAYEAREAGRRMIFSALRHRRARPSARSIFTTVMWLLGVTR